MDSGVSWETVELEHFRALLQRFAERHLDQFENLRLDTSYGLVFVLMTRELPPGWPPGAFTAVPRPGPGEIGRFARVSDPASATSPEDMLRVIVEMRNDLAGRGAREWGEPEPRTLPSLLWAGFSMALDGYYAPRGQEPTAQPGWALHRRWRPR